MYSDPVGAMLTTLLICMNDDVPAASIYRHIARLTNAGVLQVIAERRVRGAVERTYTLRSAAARIGPDEVAAMTPDEHMAAFTAYVAGMLADADRYLTSGTRDPLTDGADYRAGAMWLTHAEFAAFLRDLGTVFQRRSS